MQNLQPGKAEVKRKPAFIIHNSPAWLDQSQEWVSDGARRLYKALRSLADSKTGRLLIPGRGWIRLRTIEQKSGMCTRTRKKYMRELLALGAVRMHRDYVTRTIHGRNRKVLGVAQITVLPLHAPNPHKQQASTTVQNGENANPEPQHSVSTTVQSTTVQAENGLLGCKSCTVQEVHPQVLSETTILPSATGRGVGVCAPGSDGVAVGVSPSGSGYLIRSPPIPRGGPKTHQQQNRRPTPLPLMLS